MSALTVPRASANRTACALAAAVAMLLVFAWTAARIHYAFDGNWTAIFCTGKNFGVPADFVATTYRFPGSGYDGQFYRYLAHDPFLKRDYAGYVDAPQLRYRRLLVPLAAWLLGLGRDRAIDAAYLVVELLFVAAGVYWCARLLARRGRSPYWGLLFVLVPGTLASFDRMLVDGPLAALFAGFLLYSEERRWNRVWLMATLAALTRDTGLLLGASLVVDRLLDRDWRRAAWFATTALPTAAWYAFLATRLPADHPVTILAFPGWGLVSRLFWFKPYPEPHIQLLLRVTDVLAVLGLIVSMILAVRWIGRSRSAVTICVVLFVALGLVLGAPDHMIDSFGFGRPVSPLLLWVMIEAVSRKSWTALSAPLFVSLSVGLAFGTQFAIVARALLGR